MRPARFTLALQKVFNPKDLDDLRIYLRRLDTVAFIQSRIRSACSCDFLLWNRVLLPVYLADIFAKPELVVNLQVNRSLPFF
jgi:hypothetical protein